MSLARKTIDKRDYKIALEYQLEYIKKQPKLTEYDYEPFIGELEDTILYLAQEQDIDSNKITKNKILSIISLLWQEKHGEMEHDHFHVNCHDTSYMMPWYRFCYDILKISMPFFTKLSPCEWTYRFKVRGFKIKDDIHG